MKTIGPSVMLVGRLATERLLKFTGVIPYTSSSIIDSTASVVPSRHWAGLIYLEVSKHLKELLLNLL